MILYILTNVPVSCVKRSLPVVPGINSQSMDVWLVVETAGFPEPSVLQLRMDWERAPASLGGWALALGPIPGAGGFNHRKIAGQGAMT
jgi:hypothetical protein